MRPIKVTANHVVDLDAKPFVPNGWKIVEHRKGGRFKFGPEKIVLYLDESQQNGKYIQGCQLREKLKCRSIFNANLLDFLLAHSDLIPEEWKDKTIFFWGTIYCHPSAGLCVRCLVWRGGKWNWRYDRLKSIFDDLHSTAVPASN